MKRLLVLLVLLMGLLAGEAHATATQINAPAAKMLRVGAHGPQVAKLQWLTGNHPPNVFAKTKLHATFKGRPNGLFGKNTAAAVVAYKWQLGYPKRLLKPYVGPYFFELLTGKANRPVSWIALAAKRLAAPATGPTKIAMKIRAIEIGQLGVREHPDGSNRGPQVFIYQKVTGAYGLAWCVSFQQWAFYSSGYGTFAGATAGVYVAVDWAQPRGLLRARPKVGAIVAFVDYDRHGHRIPGTGHMGYVIRVTVGGFVSVEGNASNRVLERYHANSERPHVFIYLPGLA
jgi:hypothetical protein